MKKMTFLAAAAALACLWGCEDPLVNDIIAEVSVSPASVTFEAEGGTLKVAVTANVDFDITGAANWLKVEKSDKESFKWYQKAANMGNVDAFYNLGFCYESGTGVSKDLNKAFEWYMKGAQKKHAYGNEINKIAHLCYSEWII